MGTTKNSTKDGHCAELLERFSAFLDGELDEACCEKLQKHLDECPECAESFEGMKRMVALCRQGLGPDEVPPPRPGFRKRLSEALSKEGE